jgi:phosphohistidine swiveling domain-containing protein
MSGRQAAWPVVPFLNEAEPMDHRSGPDTAWTIINAGEAMPGVMTPLGASFWVPSMELGARAGYHDLGVLSGAQVHLPATADERLSGVFAGRFAGNVEVIRMMADLMPGGSGNAAERQMFGSVREGKVDNPTKRRYPFVAVRGPVVALTLKRRMTAQSDRIHRWWVAVTSEDLGSRPGSARARLGEAMGCVAAALRTHAVANLFVQAFSEAVSKLTERAGTPGLDLQLLGGYGGVEETRLAHSLAELAYGRESLERMLAEFGFHGPDEGEISSRSWREDPGPLLALTNAYRSLPPAQMPEAREAARRSERAQAEAALLAASRGRDRGGIKFTLGAARSFTPLRELGKANFLKGIDAGRAAARACGAELVRAGAIETAEDVFYLTAQEIVRGLPPAPVEAIAARKVLRQRYLGLALPPMWVGQAVAVPAADRDDTALDLSGVAASAGTATGVARVIEHATDCHQLEPGEILVCKTTDPSWASVFPLVSALVIDIGGLISHGAIIAREMGIPCVINTRTGTSTIRTGDHLSVDGAAGRVEIIERAAIA